MDSNSAVKRLFQWVFSDKNHERVALAQAKAKQVFCEHPHETGETYLVHLWFTLMMTSRMVFASVVILIHGVFPFLFTRTASRQMEKIWAIMRRRIPPERREELKRKWLV